jgi:hypothetical protein
VAGREKVSGLGASRKHIISIFLYSLKSIVVPGT